MLSKVCPICRKTNQGPFVRVVPYQNCYGGLPGVGRFGLALQNAEGNICCSWNDSYYYSHEQAEYAASLVDMDEILRLYNDPTLERREVPEDV